MQDIDNLMHYYFIERGIRHEESVFESQLEGQSFPWKRIHNIPYCRCLNCKEEWPHNFSLEASIECPKCHHTKWEGFNKEEERTTYVQGALREIKLFEYVFPEECLDEFLLALADNDPNKELLDEQNPMQISLALKGIRKFLGAEPVPRIKEGTTPRRIILRSTSIIPIGIKRDKKKEWKEQGLAKQEML